MLTSQALWANTQSANEWDGMTDKECLALNIYFEARSEGTAGKLAVGLVTMNRVVANRWPNTICEVVWQPAQFSWTHDGLSDTPTNYGAWIDAKYAADVALQLHKARNANHYHNNTVFPKWALKDFNQDYTGFIENHLFYQK